MKIEVNVNVNGVECHDKKHKPHLRWSVGPVREQTIPGPLTGARMQIQLTATQQTAVAVAATDKKGNPAEIESVTFTSSDPDVAAVTQDAGDDNKALVVAGKVGVAQIVVTADADMGDGTKEITGTLDVTVVAGEAAIIVVSAGAPEEQP